MSQHSAFRLDAVVQAFAGTDHASDRNTRILAISRDKAKLYRIKDIIENKSSDYYKASERWYNGSSNPDKYSVAADPTFDLVLDGETIKLTLLPVDDYYGSGSIAYMDIEEFFYPAEQDFI